IAERTNDRDIARLGSAQHLAERLAPYRRVGMGEPRRRRVATRPPRVPSEQRDEWTHERPAHPLEPLEDRRRRLGPGPAEQFEQPLLHAIIRRRLDRIEQWLGGRRAHARDDAL